MKAWLLALLLLAAGGAPAAAPVTFGDALHAKFQHPRCLQCHQFNSAEHRGRAYHSHRARFLCDRCHARHLTGMPGGEWIAPPVRLDWTGLDARETCRLIKHNLPAGDPAARMRAHLLGDVRVRWALENGMTPGGRYPTVPGGFAAFSGEVQAWVAGGMRCE